MSRVGLLVFLTLLVAAAPLSAQFNSGLQGTVSDRSSAMVPGARVVVVNLATGVTRETTTSEVGAWRIPSLSPGAYKITVEKQGFVTAVQESVTVAGDELLVGHPARRNDFPNHVCAGRKTAEGINAVCIRNCRSFATIFDAIVVRINVNGYTRQRRFIKLRATCRQAAECRKQRISRGIDGSDAINIAQIVRAGA